ncbi:MAG TPA: hypothetical protein VEX43_03550 [Chthoniobacterales bacterium]|nr:hypothetical protein [Chthoniobacterales bacterium]
MAGVVNIAQVILNDGDFEINGGLQPSGHPHAKSCQAPLPPEYCLSRTGIEDVLVKAVVEQSSAARLRIVRGPSGCGKTTAVANAFREICQDRAGTWVDCRIHRSVPPEINSGAVAVFDNLNSLNHPAMKEDWFARCRATGAVVFVTTTAEIVERALIAKFACAAFHDVSVPVDFLSNAEALTFLENTVVGFDSNRATYEKLLDCARGRPLMFQLLSALAGHGVPTGELNHQACPGDDPLGNLVRQWLLECVQNQATNDVLEVLCKLTFIGMSVKTLSAILEKNIEDVGEAVKPLIARGIVTISCRNRGGHEQILAVHDTVRESDFAHAVESETEAERRAVYLKLLRKSINTESGSDVDMLASLDAWIACWSAVFQPAPGTEMDNQKFQALYQDCEQLLPKLVDPSNSWTYFERDVESFLDHKISEDMWCAPLTALGHLLRDLPPSSLLAEMMWRASRNYDGWGRASAMGVSCSHWYRLGRDARKRGAKKVREWLQYAAARADQADPDDDSWGRREDILGLDVLVAIASLARMESDHTALGAMAASDYQQNFSQLQLPRLAMLVKLGDSGLLNASSFEELWRGINHITPMLLRVGEYLLTHKQLDPETHRLLNHLRDKYGPAEQAPNSLSMDIARYAFSPCFAEYVRKTEPGAQRHF